MKTRRFGVPERAAGIVMIALLAGAAVVATGFSPELQRRTGTRSR